MEKIRSIRVRGQGPFFDFRIVDIPSSAKLVVLVGENGTGKTSLLQALTVGPNHIDSVKIDWHGQSAGPYKVFARSAYRAEHNVGYRPGTALSGLRPRPPHYSPNAVSPDLRMTDNIAYVVAESLRRSAESEVTLQGAISEFYSRLSGRLMNVFSDLSVEMVDRESLNTTDIAGTSNMKPLVFKKDGKAFPFEGLSAGEREVFDLLFDLQCRASDLYDCLLLIDEPELHLHASLQSKLMAQLYELVPETTQLWIATHSIGMLREAFSLYKREPSEVTFLEFKDRNIHKPQEIHPSLPSRDFWREALKVALGDLADLVLPKTTVLCEGRPLGLGSQKKGEFDAKVYRKIFYPRYPDVDFVSGGGSGEVDRDLLKLASAVSFLAKGTKVVRLLDRDQSSPDELAERSGPSLRFLSRYSIENFLWCDEIIQKLLKKYDLVPKAEEVIRLVRSDGDEDFSKPIKENVGQAHAALRKLSCFRNSGSTAQEFAIWELAPLITPETLAYANLEKDVFGFG